MALSKEYSGIKLRTAFDSLTIFLFHFSSSLIDIVCGKCSIQLTQSGRVIAMVAAIHAAAGVVFPVVVVVLVAAARREVGNAASN